MRKFWIETIKDQMGLMGVNVADDEAVIDTVLEKYANNMDRIHPYTQYEISEGTDLYRFHRKDEDTSYDDILEYNLYANYLEFWT